jgi:hypothetical protein
LGDIRCEPPRPIGCTDDLDRVEVVASDDVRRFIADGGGELYVWVSRHGGCCRGALSLMEAETQRPERPLLAFRRVSVAGFDLYLDAARRYWPLQLELELTGRGRRVSAYWNGQAWVG